MEIKKAISKFGELAVKHVEENICEVTKQHAEDFLHSLPDFLGGHQEKKDILDQLEDLGYEITRSLFKHYLKVDIKSFLDLDK